MFECTNLKVGRALGHRMRSSPLPPLTRQEKVVCEKAELAETWNLPSQRSGHPATGNSDHPVFSGQGPSRLLQLFAEGTRYTLACDI